MSPGRRTLWALRVVTVVVAVVAGMTALVAEVSTPSDDLHSASGAVPTASLARAAVDATEQAAASRPGSDVGVAVLDLQTGDLATNDLGDEAMNAASLAKLFTVVDVLSQRTAGRYALDAGDTELIRRALGPSDDDAMNTLWSRFDGADAVARVIDRVELEDSSVPDDPSQWGEVQVSARDMARLFGYVRNRLAPADRDLVLSALAAAPPVAVDGFDQAYGLLAADGRGAAAAKQGWLCCLRSRIDLHSAGVLSPDGRYAVALLSNQPFGYDAARGVLDDAASAARTALART